MVEDKKVDIEANEEKIDSGFHKLIFKQKKNRIYKVIMNFTEASWFVNNISGDSFILIDGWGSIYLFNTFKSNPISVNSNLVRV